MSNWSIVDEESRLHRVNVNNASAVNNGLQVSGQNSTSCAKVSQLGHRDNSSALSGGFSLLQCVGKMNGLTLKLLATTRLYFRMLEGVGSRC